MSVDNTTGLKTSTNSFKERKVVVPGVGTATQLPNGEIRVRYPDGAQLWVDGKQNVRYQYPDGRIVNFSNTDSIPRQITERLQQMPKVLKHLMPSASGGSIGSHRTRSLR